MVVHGRTGTYTRGHCRPSVILNVWISPQEADVIGCAAADKSCAISFASLGNNNNNNIDIYVDTLYIYNNTMII